MTEPDFDSGRAASASSKTKIRGSGTDLNVANTALGVSAGAAVGSLVGAVVVPGIGIVIGPILGATVGGVLGNYASRIGGGIHHSK